MHEHDRRSDNTLSATGQAEERVHSEEGIQQNGSAHARDAARHRHIPVIPAANGGTMLALPDGEHDAESSARAHRINADLRREERLKGSRPGDRYIRTGRTVGPFRRVGAGMLTASLEAEQPRGPLGRFIRAAHRVLVGEPISSEHSIHERLTKVKALAVLSSDPLSSVAYATEEILRVLVLVSLSAMVAYAMPIGVAIMLLLAIVVISYRQTIAEYPRGGGSYIVAKDNLGTLAGLTAGASILIDYTMTVAVSVSAGIDAVNSLWPELRPLKIEICLAVIFFITIANLRGVRESGNIFALPTYLFIFGILAMLALGFARHFFALGGGLEYIPPEETLTVVGEPLTLFLLLRAFTQGCTALTGVEAIADGVPAFKPPEARNARTTLIAMAAISLTMFGGITFLATQMKVLPSEAETVLSQIARNIFAVGPQWFSDGAWFYINIATALILVLAANTAFSDFPRLGYFLARDKFLPHQFSFRGDRLAFSWGIVTLAILASVLIIAFGGNVTALIPLYTVGVFNSFTLSQAGMVVRWWRKKSPGWQRNMLINGLGMTVTGVVLVISAITKFALGAWIVIVLIPLLIGMFLAINRHYRHFETEVEVVVPIDPTLIKHTVIVPIARLNTVALSALAYARSLSANVTAVHIAEGEDPEEAQRFNEEWKRLLPNTDVGLVIIESPFRSLLGPLMAYIDALDQQHPDDTITIVLPELLPSRFWEYLLHNQSALRLKAALLFRPNTVVTNVPYVLAGRRPVPGSRGFWNQVPLGPIIIAALLILLIYYVFIF